MARSEGEAHKALRRVDHLLRNRPQSVRGASCRATSLLVHEIFGGMSPFASCHLRRLGRRAAEEGTDSTDYSQSYTAASFVSYYAQRISNNIVMYGADGFLKQLGKVIKTRAKGRNRASSI